MGSVLPVVLFAFAGVLAGGAYSMHRQGAGRTPVVILGLFALLAFGGGALWLMPAS